MAESGIKRDIPVKLGNFSVIDTEFASIRERFEDEMRKMEDEMSKFRSDLLNRESNFFETTSRWEKFIFIKNHKNNEITWSLKSDYKNIHYLP